MIVADLLSMIRPDRENLDEIEGEQYQRGFGRYTLCPRCNNNTGSWYGTAYLEWVWYAVRVLSVADRRQSFLYLPFHIFPLKVIKQVVCMFLASTDIGFRDANEHLARFVLDRERRGIDPEISIYAFLNPSPRARSTGIAAIVTPSDSRATIKVVNEIALAPIGYLMTLGSVAPDERLVDISFFAGFGYNDWKDVWLNLPILPVYAPFPADYRTRDEVLEAGRKGRKQMRENRKREKQRPEHA